MAGDKSTAARATSIDLGHDGHTFATNSSSSHDSGHPSPPTAQHGAPVLLTTQDSHSYSHGHTADAAPAHGGRVAAAFADPKLTLRQKLAYIKTREFWIIMALGQFLAIAVTGSNTLTTLLVMEGTSIPAFQTLFVYVGLNLMYTGYTLYKYGVKKWARMVLKDGWKYIILAFFDVEGNYFTVLAYRYTTILSAQLINFWAIVVVVVISFIFLRVRYHWAQVLGIVICVGGMGILLTSDHITGVNGGDIPGSVQLKGDLFALVGATCYGLSNVYEEWFVSGRPLYEVVGQLGFWGMIINGVQAGIFDRSDFHSAVWNSKVGGYLAGYTLILIVFYTCTPLLYRLSSAAFFNISLLTSNFWGAIIGIKVFGVRVYYLYPIAFTLIMVGHFVYYLGKGVLGEAKKAWLGENQERGVSGVGTAKRKLERGEVGVEGAGVAGVV